MATAAQILANRENAALSTGPKTESGKASVAQNALKTGLFSKGCLVSAQQRPDFESLRESLWQSFAPRTAAEELIVNEIIRAAWRLQMCALTEAGLSTLHNNPEAFSRNQTAIDRARVQATGIVNRQIEQLRKLQTDRWIKRETLPDDFEIEETGIASPKPVIAAVAAQARLESKKKSEDDIQGHIATLDRFFQPPVALSTVGHSSAAPGTKQTQFPTSALALGDSDRIKAPGTKQTQSPEFNPTRLFRAGSD